MLAWLWSAREAHWARRAAALRTRRADLLQRVRLELPMKIALELLLRYDPDGDHKTLIELPTSYAEDVARLRAEKVELAGVVDALLGRLLSVGGGGEASARDGTDAAWTPRPAAPLILTDAAALSTPTRGSAVALSASALPEGARHAAGAVNALLHELLPEASVDALLKHAEALPRSSPLLDNLVRRRTPAGGSPMGGAEEAADWVVRTVAGGGGGGSCDDLEPSVSDGPR